MSQFSEWLARKRRIFARVIEHKALPPFLYRWDSRPPGMIRASGFQPWNNQGNITLVDHVKGAFPLGHANYGQHTKTYSQWVSTGAYGMLKKFDATFAQQAYNSYLYKIDSATALAAGQFMDANDFFDKASIRRPYPTQREWIKLGGIPANAVTHFMPGSVFVNQLNLKGLAPDENQLQSWQAF